VILGPALGVCVLDVESEAGHGIDGRMALRGRVLPLTLAARTATGGDHLYYLRPHLPDVPSIPDFLPGVEFRSDRSHVAIPPSVIGEGHRGAYAWAVDAPIAELPLWIRDRIAPAAGVPSGQKAKRGSRATSLQPSEGALDHVARIFRICSCGDLRCDCQRPIRSSRGVGLTHCPSHHDEQPSLSVGIEGGRTLIRCQRRPPCSQAQVIADLTLLGAWP
jgi:hypothetical protein